MTLRLQHLFARLQAPAGGDADGSADRGDNFTPSADDVAAAAGTPAAILAEAKAGPKDDKAGDAKGAKADDKGDDKVDDKDKGEDKGRDAKGRFIPLERHEAVLTKARDAREVAERKNAELEARLAEVTKTADTGKLEEEIVTLEQQHAKLVVDGDHEKAAQVMTQIRLKERTIALSQTEALSSKARADAAEEVRMDMAIASLEETYTVMNPADESYDQDVVDMVLGQQRLLMERDRLPASKALVKAATTVMTKLMPPNKEEPAAKGLGAAKSGEDRTTKAKAKNLDAALKTPPSLDDVGKDTDKAGMTNGNPVLATVEDLKDLPDATKRRLRGDMI